MIQPDSYIREPAETLPRRTRHRPGLGEDPPRQQERPFHPAQRRLVAGGPAGGARCRRGPARTIVAKITTGACISVEGELVASPGQGPGGGVEGAARCTVHGAADPEHYPLQKKKHTLETLRELGHLRARSNTFGAVFRVRNALACAIHKFFQDRGFLYVHTPVISASDAEGAGSMFQVTTLDLERLGKSGKPPDFAQDFFGKHTYLTVSGQLEAEIFALAFANVYTFGPTFRAENSNTPRHLAEFYMIEPEMAFCDLNDNQDLAEAFLKSQVEQVVDACGADLDFLGKWYDPELRKTLDGLVNASFERITYTEAIALLEKSGKNFEFPTDWGADLQSEHERYLTEEVFKKPVIVTDYPEGHQGVLHARQRRRQDGGRDGRAGAAHRRDHRRQPARRAPRRAAGAHSRHGGARPAEEAYWWYLDLRRFGGVEHAGFGMGFERMLMYLTGMKNIRDVIPFPRTPGNAEF